MATKYQPGSSDPDPAGLQEPSTLFAENPALRSAFDELRDAATNNIHIDQLGPLLQAVELDLTEDELENLVRAELSPEATYVSYEQCHQLWARALADRGLLGAANLPGNAITATGGFRESALAAGLGQLPLAGMGSRLRLPLCVRRLWWKAVECTAISEHSALRGTPLLIAVVVLSLFTAGGVAGLALGLAAAQKTADTRADITTQADMVRGFFSAVERQEINAKQKSLSEQASVVATMVETIGHNLTMELVRQQLGASAASLALVLEQVAISGALSVHRTALVTGLVPMADFLNLTWPILGEAAILTYVEQLNRGSFQQNGYSVTLGRLDANRRGVTVLTSASASSNDGRRSANDTYFSLESNDAGEALRRGASGETGTLIAPDIFGVPCIAAYTYLAGPQVGVTFKKTLAAVQEDITNQLTTALDGLNTELPGSLEIVLGEFDTTAPPNSDGTQAVRYATAFKDAGLCSAYLSQGLPACGSGVASTALRKGLAGLTGADIGTDYRRVRVIGGYAPILSLRMGLVFKVDGAEVVGNIISPLTNALDRSNRDLFTGTQEVVLAQAYNISADYNRSNGLPPPAGSFRIRALTVGTLGTSRRLEDTTQSVPQRLAAVERQDGVSVGVPDYRGVSTVAAYRYLEGVDLGLVLKVDVQELQQAATDTLVTVADSFNAEVGFTREVMLADGSQLLTQPRCAAEASCSVEPMAIISAALKGAKATVKTHDYTGEPVLAAYGKVSSTAVIVKSDLSRVMRPLAVLIAKVVCGSVGFTIAGVGITFLVAKRMLSRMRTTWRSKLQLEERVKQIEAVMANMYPKSVAERMLRGDRRIVDVVPQLTCIMVDIHHFTYLSNNLSAEELVDLLGYTFGCMDACADFHGIYKVKTIGDCYMALAGLPSTASEGAEHAVRALHFSSGVLQLFSEHFRHPESGAVILRKALEVKSKDRSSVNPSGSISQTSKPQPHYAASHESSSSGAGGSDSEQLRIPVSNSKVDSVVSKGSASEVSGGSGSKAQGSVSAKRTYSMRIGLASGPATVGILPGKTPLYDVWGPTINLASRMESTGQPGMIQVSEGTYRTLAQSFLSAVSTDDPAAAAGPYDFSPPRTTYAKGFGNVRSWLVTRTRLPVDESIVSSLGLKFTFREFCFGSGPAGGLAVPPAGSAAAAQRSQPVLVEDVNVNAEIKSQSSGGSQHQAVLTFVSNAWAD